MRKFLLSIAVLLIAGAAFAQPIGVRVTKDVTNSRLLVRADNGEWLGVWGSGTPSFTTFLGENVPAGAIYFNTATGTPYRFSSGSWAASSGGTAAAITPGTTTVGSSTDCFLFADGSSVSQCDNTLAKLDNSGSGNGALTMLKTPSGGDATSNFLRITGTAPSTLTAAFNGFVYNVTSAGSSSQNNVAAAFTLGAGYSGSSRTTTLQLNNSVAGTGTNFLGTGAANYGMLSTASGAGAGTTVGVAGSATGSTGMTVGVYGRGTSAAGDNGVSIVGVYGLAFGPGTGLKRAGGYFTLDSLAVGTIFDAAIIANNGTVAAPIFAAQDNGAALPTTAATATWQIQDGAWPQIGNGVLTNGTMAAETQARDSGSMIHSYTWTNAQIVALGAVGNGDITVATLPAKTVVKNAYVVIITPDTSANNLTVACGRTGATFLDYIGNSDAKAAANTVYGDASGERGANLTGYDLPSYTTTTDVKCHFIKTTTTLDTVLGSTGRVILETSLVP